MGTLRGFRGLVRVFDRQNIGSGGDNVDFGGLASEAILDLLVHELALLGNTAEHGRVLLGTTQEIGDDLSDGAIGQILVDRVAVLAQGVGDLVLHAKELAKVHDARARQNVLALHLLDSRHDRLAVVGSNHEDNRGRASRQLLTRLGLMVVQLAEQELDSAIVGCVGIFQSIVNGRSVSEFGRTLKKIHY